MSNISPSTQQLLAHHRVPSGRPADLRALDEVEGFRERARLFGGEARIDSVRGQGTRVCGELPVVDREPTT